MQSGKSLLWEGAWVSWECSETWASAGFHLGLRDGHFLRVQETEHGQRRNKIPCSVLGASSQGISVPVAHVQKADVMMGEARTQPGPHSTWWMSALARMTTKWAAAPLCTVLISGDSHVMPGKVPPELQFLCSLGLIVVSPVTVLHRMTFPHRVHTARCGRLSHADVRKHPEVHTVLKSPDNTSLRTNPCR